MKKCYNGSALITLYHHEKYILSLFAGLLRRNRLFNIIFRYLGFFCLVFLPVTRNFKLNCCNFTSKSYGHRFRAVYGFLSPCRSDSRIYFYVVKTSTTYCTRSFLVPPLCFVRIWRLSASEEAYYFLQEG